MDSCTIGTAIAVQLAFAFQLHVMDSYGEDEPKVVAVDILSTPCNGFISL